MRIAQIAPLFETVPPRRYGGTERVVHWLTEELVARGHDVTLFASGNSTTSATLVPVRERAVRFMPNFERNAAPYARMLEIVRRRAREFDVLHFHIDFHPFSLFTRQPVPFVNTLHGRLDQDWVPDIYNLFPEVPLVSVSNSQRRPMPHLNWAASVLHGMPADLLTPCANGRGDYFAFLGRISPEKGIETAIRIAAAAGANSASPPRSARKTCSPTATSSPPCSSTTAWNSWAKSTTARNPTSSPAPAPCCSRSTGPSPSAW